MSGDERKAPNADAMTSGAALVEKLLEQYGDIPLSKIEGISSVGTVSQTWKSRPRSNIVKRLMEKSGRTLGEIADGIGCSKAYLNNKLHRDSFSIDDLVTIAYICGYGVTFTPFNSSDSGNESFQISVDEYFSSYDEEALARLRKHKEEARLQKRDEYEELKVRLSQMKEEYGFED